MSGLIVALDYSSAEEAMGIAEALVPHVDGFKVGLELLMAAGSTVVATVSDLGRPVFADVKLHDIPNTVAGAARALGRLGARWVTVHAEGGLAMVQAAREGLTAGAGGTAGVLAVTVLTSLSGSDMSTLYPGETLDERTYRLAGIARAAGAEGVVTSVHQCTAVRAAAPDLDVFAPGIRPARSKTDDQARVATPAEAAAAGVDYAVVGRAITGADDPVTAAVAIGRELQRPGGGV